MKKLIQRNLKLYFRDKTAVFFSLLSVLIVLALYVLFLSNVQVESIKRQIGTSISQQDISYLVNTWILAGMLSITTATSTLGALGFMISDKEKQIIKDFKSAPLTTSTYPIAAIITAIIVGIIMSTLTFFIYTLYIFINTGNLFSTTIIIQTLGLIILSALMNASLMGLLVSFLSTNNAYSSASILIGTTIGFINGLYVPLGQLPDTLQKMIKLLPFSHIASLFRKTIMTHSLTTVFHNAPKEITNGYTNAFGIILNWNNKPIPTILSITFITIVFITSLLLFFANYKRKREII